MLKFVLALTLTLYSELCTAVSPNDLVIVTLTPDTEYHCSPKTEPKDRTTVYCYYGTTKALTNIWQTVSAVVEMKPPEKYDVYEGRDECDVRAQFESSQSKWGFSLFNWGRRSIQLHPFNVTCLGIRAAKNYTLKVQVTPVNTMLVGCFMSGALLFFLAPLVVHNQLFYYVTGTAVGVFASVLVVMYLVLTLLPLKKPAMIGMMAGGSTVVFYFFQSFMDYTLAFIPMYTKVVYGYLIVSGFISFGFCYRFGPLSNPRSKNILQWTLQIFSLSLVFFSSYNPLATTVFAVFIVLLYRFPIIKLVLNYLKNKAVKAECTSLVARVATPCKRSMRKKLYLTEEEYRVQGTIETERGLAEIRRFCSSSPDNWEDRIDSGNLERFTKFMRGEPHVTREELEANMVEELLTDDED